jgi:hypothetical protein
MNEMLHQRGDDVGAVIQSLRVEGRWPKHQILSPACSIWHARRNKVRKLIRNADGTWCPDKQSMEGLVNSYFNDLYKKDPNVEPQVLTSLFECCISEEMNMSLCKTYTEEEIADALF